MARDVPTGRSNAEPAPSSREGGRESAADRARERRARAAAPAGSGGERTPPGGSREFGGGLRRFVHESVGELRKVDWPTQKQLLSATLAVIIACVVVGVFLFVADEAFRHLVKDVLLAG